MDSARILAALLVVLNHARDLIITDYNGQIAWAPLYFLAGFGAHAVTLFFVLSGYWITASVVARANMKHFWHSYLLQRLTRIYAVLIPAVLLGGLADLAGARIWELPIYLGTSGAHSLIKPVADNLGLTNFLGTLAFLQGLATQSFGSNSPLWSLAYEFWYYLWFPALFLAITQRRISLALVTLLPGIIYPQLLLSFPAWLAGAALYWCANNARASRIRSLFSHAGIFWVTLLLFSAVMAVTRSFSGPVVQFAVASAFAILLLAAHARGASLFNAPRLLARWGARGSYSLYAIHYPICLLASGTLLFWMDASRLPPSWLSFAAIAGVIILCFVVALLFARATEAKTDWLRARLSRTVR